MNNTPLNMVTAAIPLFCLSHEIDTTHFYSPLSGGLFMIIILTLTNALRVRVRARGQAPAQRR